MARGLGPLSLPSDPLPEAHGFSPDAGLCGQGDINSYQLGNQVALLPPPPANMNMRNVCNEVLRSCHLTLTMTLADLIVSGLLELQASALPVSYKTSPMRYGCLCLSVPCYVACNCPTQLLECYHYKWASPHQAQWPLNSVLPVLTTYLVPRRCKFLSSVSTVESWCISEVEQKQEVIRIYS